MEQRALNSLQLRHALLTNTVTQSSFNYIISRDILQYIQQCPKMIIGNTDNSEGNGEHWILMYFPSEKSIEVYDSLGTNMENYEKDIQLFINRFNIIKICKVRVQSKLSNISGHYCLFFACMRCKGYDMGIIIKKHSQCTMDKTLYS